MTRSRFSAPLLLGATLGVGLGLGLGTVFSAAQAQDAPGPDVTSPEVAPQSLKSPSGPSAKMAARLKYSPPNNYLRHYLGDDRYKVAGGVWKLVSTQLDVYYHRASCPNMLKQSPDIVIGFADKASSEEGGYRPCTTCQPAAESVLFAGQAGAPTFLSAPQRMKLADETSYVTVPAGWRRMVSDKGEFFNMRFTTDVFQSKNGKDTAAITSMNLPQNMSLEHLVERMMNKEHRQSSDAFMRGLGNSSPQLKQFSNVGQNYKKGTWGGLVSYTFQIPKTSVRTNRGVVKSPGGTLVMASRGTTMYMFGASKSPGAEAIRNSFKAQ